MLIRRAGLTSAAALALTLAACSKDSATEPTETLVPDDYALVVFGETGAALAGTLGDSPADRSFDGRRGAPDHRPDLALTPEQRTQILALRLAFREANQADLEAMRAVFAEARAAREAGATREEIHAILAAARPIADRLRENVRALHEAILALLTDEQRAQLRRNRPPVPPAPPSVRPPMGPRGGGR